MVCIDEEIPFEIPESWCWERVSNIFILNPKIDAKAEIDAAFIPMEAITACYGSEFRYYKKKWGEIKNGFTHFADGDIAFAKITPCFQNRKSVILRDLPNGIGAGTTELRVLRAYNDTIIPLYVLYFLESSYFVDEASFKGTANQQRIIPGYLESKLFPIPPKKEQIRIVEQIKTLIPIIDRYGKSQSLLNNLNGSINVLLRKSILQEAIQGKLVPQNPADEPASELLKRIKEEKECLVKAKKIKADKNESVIFKGDDNCYYEQIGETALALDVCFPASWEAIRLGSICQLLDGEKRVGRGVCMDAKFLRGKSEGNEVDNGRYVHQGDSIILVDGENSGEIFTVPQSGYMGSTFKQLWVSAEMHLPYVLSFLLFYKSTLRNSKKGAAIPHLNKDLFNNLIIGIPPVEEQKRIAQKFYSLFQQLK